jgi:hypothetical protein
LEALCFLSASSCQLEDQAQLGCSPDSPQQLQLLQQHGQNSKGSSYTVEAAAAPRQLSNGWLAAAGVRQPSPGSDVSSDGCQGALARPEQQQQQLAASLHEIHPGAHPVDIEQLAPAGTQQQQVKARKGSRKQQQPLLGSTPQQQQHCNAVAFEPLASLHSSSVLAMQQAAAAGQQPQQAVHAPVAALGLSQPLLPAQLASLLQAGNYDAAAAAAAAALSSVQPLAALQPQQQPQQQHGLSELLGLLSVGLPHAAGQQPQLPLLPMAAPAQQHAAPAPAQPVHAAVKRPPVKGCYWHVYIANMIAAGRKEQEAREQQQESQQQLGRIAVTAAAEQQQQQLGLAMQRKSSSPRLMEDGFEGGSPCKRQKRQESPAALQQPQQQPEQAAMPQLQLPPAAPLPNWLAAAGVPPPTLALAAAAAAATAAGQAGMLPQLLQAPALSGPLAVAASSMGLLGHAGLPAVPLLGMPPAAALGGAPGSPPPELLLQLLTQQQQLGMDAAAGAAAVRAAPGLPGGFPLQAAGLLQGGGFPAGALLQALAAPGMGLVAQQ